MQDVRQMMFDFATNKWYSRMQNLEIEQTKATAECYGCDQLTVGVRFGSDTRKEDVAEGAREGQGGVWEGGDGKLLRKRK